MEEMHHTKQVLVFEIQLQLALVVLEFTLSAFPARERNIWMGTSVHPISF